MPSVDAAASCKIENANPRAQRDGESLEKRIRIFWRRCSARAGHVTATISCLAISLLVATSASGQTVEQFYAGKTIQFLVGVQAGGGNDFTMRLIARHIGRHIPGEPKTVPQNMVGAAGLALANFMYEAAPKDGTHVALISNGIPARQAVGLPGVKLDATNFNWIGSMGGSTETMYTWHASGVKTLADARTKSEIAGAVGVAGITSSFPRMLNLLLGTQFRIVEGYPGSPALDLAIERGEAGARNNTWESIKTNRAAWLKEEKIHILAYAGSKPADLPPGIPSVEQFLDTDAKRHALNIVIGGSRLGHPFAMVPGAPPDRVAAMRAAFLKTMSDPAFVADATAASIMIEPISGDGLVSIVKSIVEAPAEVRKMARAFYE